LHAALVDEPTLIILHDRGEGFEHQLAFGVLHRILQVEILNRNVVRPEFETAAS